MDGGREGGREGGIDAWADGWVDGRMDGWIGLADWLAGCLAVWLPGFDRF